MMSRRGRSNNVMRPALRAGGAFREGARSDKGEVMGKRFNVVTNLDTRDSTGWGRASGLSRPLARSSRRSSTFSASNTSTWRRKHSR
jgi:hypothetical protein